MAAAKRRKGAKTMTNILSPASLTRSNSYRTILAGGLALALLSVPMTGHAGGKASWSPQASERLVRLPSTYIQRSVDRDFAGSNLAAAIGDQAKQIASKEQSIRDLMAAVPMSEGKVRTELQHQVLVEKRALVQLMGERIELQRRATKTRIDLYNSILSRVVSQGDLEMPNEAALSQAQDNARKRLARIATKVDTTIFGSQARQSKYAKESAKYEMAIQKLAQKINKHPMNRLPNIDGEKVDRKTYLRRLIQDQETEFAFYTQQEEVLGYMGKLVALDAMALNEKIEQADTGPGGGGVKPPSNVVAEAVKLFLD